MTQDKPLCYAPFIAMYSTSNGQYAPCCVSKKWLDSSPTDYWYSDKIKKIRKQLLNNEWPDTCSRCKLKKEANLEDETGLWNKYFLKYVSDTEISIENGNSTGYPFFLDYRPSNTCNLKCRMCSPNLSSKFNDEVKENLELQKWLNPYQQKYDNYQKFLSYSEAADLKIIKITGGEPTIDPNVIKFLENIIKKYNKKPILRFTTNGTNLNKRFQNIMKEFDDIRVAFSVDAVDDTFEYIRTNANWQKVKKNIETVFEKNLCSDYGFNVVLMPYNIFSIIDLLEWFYELFQKGYDFYVNFDTSDIDYTSLNSVRDDHKIQILSDLESWLIYKKDFRKSIDGIDNLANIIKKSNFSQKSYNDFKEFNNLLDKIRKTELINLDDRLRSYV